MAHLFAVTAFEGALVVLGSAALALFWIWLGPLVPEEDVLVEARDEPRLIIESLPLPARRSGRRRKPQGIDRS